MTMVNIVLADDHTIVRQGISLLLNNERDFRIVGEACDGIEAVRLVERLDPDVLILDLRMPALNGLAAMRQVRQIRPRTHIVVLSMHTHEAYVLEAFRCGADAYVFKSRCASDLLEAIRLTMVGRRYVSASLAEKDIRAYLERAAGGPVAPYERLTAREREVLQLAAEGQTCSDIGRRLFISRRTVEIHRSSLMRKLKLKSQTDLVRFAISNGILSVEGPFHAWRSWL